MRPDLLFRPISALFTLSSEQINPHLFQVSLSLGSVYRCAFACIITRLEVLEEKLSMKRLTRSRGGKNEIENKEINLTSVTAIILFLSTRSSELTLSNF